MKSTEEKLAKSLSATSVELIPYLPYLLQDLWELGSSPRDMVALVQKHGVLHKDSRVLDLACGKGAVSVALAKELGCAVKGVDLLPVFIEEARRMAKVHGVDALCAFQVGDIQVSVTQEKDYHLVVLGAVGDVLGNPEETLRALGNTIRPGGHVLLDDGYGAPSAETGIHSRMQWMEHIESAGFAMVDEMLVNETELAFLMEEQMLRIAQRVEELKVLHPQHADLFQSYMESQLAEVEELTHDVVGVTMLLRKA